MSPPNAPLIVESRWILAESPPRSANTTSALRAPPYPPLNAREKAAKSACRGHEASAPEGRHATKWMFDSCNCTSDTPASWTMSDIASDWTWLVLVKPTGVL